MTQIVWQSEMKVKLTFLADGDAEMNPVYTIRSVEEQTQTAQPVFCLQCKKALIPVAGFSLEVKDEHGILGYLHPQGTCKAEWEKAHPR